MILLPHGLNQGTQKGASSIVVVTAMASLELGEIKGGKQGCIYVSK